MGKIRKLYYFDKKNTQEMVSFLNSDAGDSYIDSFMFNPLLPLHHLLPLKLKYLPESYIYKDNGEIKALITVAPMKTYPKKMEIQKLFFEENSYDAASELVQYVVSRYKAMGAASIMVKVESDLSELLTMLITKCGFSQISSEKLWRVNKFTEDIYDETEYRHYRHSDSKIVAEIYNDSLLPHFRPLLSKSEKDFEEKFFKGLSYYSEYKYIILDKESKGINGYISIQTSDNQNYIVDVIQKSCVDLSINSIIHFTSEKIKKRKKRFGMFIKSKKYVNSGEKYELSFAENKFECVQNSVVLTNSSAKILKDSSRAGKYTVVNNLLPSNTVSTKIQAK